MIFLFRDLALLINVYAIPPPIRILSVMLTKFLITPILSETLAPPRMATTGL